MGEFNQISKEDCKKMYGVFLKANPPEIIKEIKTKYPQQRVDESVINVLSKVARATDFDTWHSTLQTGKMDGVAIKLSPKEMEALSGGWVWLLYAGGSILVGYLIGRFG